jgi:hypothetical protein
MVFGSIEPRKKMLLEPAQKKRSTARDHCLDGGLDGVRRLSLGAI